MMTKRESDKSKASKPIIASNGIAPNVSGTFQISEDSRVENLEDQELMSQYGLDEETLIYARQFMED